MALQIRAWRSRAEASDDFSAIIGCVLACLLVFGALFLAGKMTG
jgi:hypothetical protein